jgi:iron(III) transport system ATP-binding protein
MTGLSGKAASVEFEGITKIYDGGVKAVDNVSLRVEPGTLTTLLGPSGCGKTTTLRMIAGLEMATAGRILIGDQDVTRLPATAPDVSMVFQSYALFPHMTVQQNVAYGLTVTGRPKAEIAGRVETTLGLVRMTGYGARLPSELSGGQQQRVAVARALILEPEVLLFNELLSNLDAKLRRRVQEEIREIQQTLGLTVVYVTHDQEEALAVSDTIVVMNNAVIAQSGSPRSLYDFPDSEFVADFMGEANIIAAKISAVADGIAEVRIAGMGLSLPSRGLKPGAAKLAVRPHNILFEPAGTPNTLAGQVTKATYVGRHIEYQLEVDGTVLFAMSSATASPVLAGASVLVGFTQGAPVLLPN